MAASTIDRTNVNLTDDTGGGTDGTVINAAWATAFMDEIDDLLDGTTADPLILGCSLVLEGSKTLLINETANAQMTVGITINQGASDDEAIALKSSDIAHGRTSIAETDTYAFIQKLAAASGGLEVRAIEESQITAIRIYGVSGADDTTRSTAGRAPIELDASLGSGTSDGSVGADGALVAIRNKQGTRFIFDADGDSHQDVGTAWTNYDTFQDVELLTALSAGVSRPGDPVRAAFVDLLEAHRDTLERIGLVTFAADGHHFVNMSKLQMLTVGAVRQLADRVAWLSTPWYQRVWRRLPRLRALGAR